MWEVLLFLVCSEYLLKSGLISYFNDFLLSSITDYKKNKDYSVTLYNRISNDSNILGIDNYMNEKINEINNILEAI